MPEYLYQNQDTQEIRSIIQTMKEKHEYHGENGGENWVRIFIVPQMNFDSISNVDPFSKSDFSKYTENKRGKYGDVMDASAELSQKREQKDGKDPIKEKYFADYKKRTKSEHFKNRPTTFENDRVKIDLDD